MRTRFLFPCLLFTLLVVATADAQPGLPSGAEQVVMGRLFHRSASGTLPVARFGLVVGRSGPSRTVLQVPARDDDPAAGYSLEISAERRRGAVRLSWSLQPAGAASLSASQGSQEVLSGVLGHLSIAEASGSRLYASVESGRASSFDALKLARHFGVELGGPASSPPPPAPRPAVSAAPRTPAVVASPRAQAPPAPSSAILNLSFRLLQDGEVAFAPRVRVRAGQAFAVRGGQALDAAGERWDGLELSGVARLQGGSCLLELAVQSGRSLEEGEEQTWLVDRYRRDVVVRLDVESELPLFEDLQGASSGELELIVGCEQESAE